MADPGDARVAATVHVLSLSFAAAVVGFGVASLLLLGRPALVPIPISIGLVLIAAYALAHRGSPHVAARVLVVGSANVDFAVAVSRLPAPGETVSGGTLLVNHGGKGANQAVAARRLGAEVRFVGCVGDDASGVAICQAPIASTASTMPAPWRWTLSRKPRPGLPHQFFGSAVLRRTSATVAGPAARRSGRASSRRAATPATCGDAIDVPLIVAYPSSSRG